MIHYWIADWNLSHAEAELLLHHTPTGNMVDVTHSSLSRVIKFVREGHFAAVGAYVTGTSDIRWTAEDLNSVGDGPVVVKIDQTNQDLPMLALVKWVAEDVEPGAETANTVATIAHQREQAHEDTMIYCSRAFLPGIENAIARRGLPHGTIVAYQWASPTSNPETPLCPGGPTLKECNADLTVVRLDFLQKHAPVLPPKKVTDVTDQARISLTVGIDPDDGQWKAQDVAVLPLPHGKA